MPRLSKKATRPHTPSKALRKKKKPAFQLSLRGMAKTCAFGLLGVFVIWLCISETPGKLTDEALTKVHNFSARHGLAVKVISIDGNYYTKKDEILKHLDIQKGTSILDQDPAEIKEKAEALPWIRSAKVQRILPNKILIKVAEKLPIALWQKNKTLTLVDDKGHLIEDADTKKFTYLPIVIGEDAAKRAPTLFSELTSQPYLQKRLSAAILISKRRWDLVLDKKLKIQLPEKNIGKSLKYLSKLQQDNKIDSKDILSIDLRVPDRLYVHLKQKAATARRHAGQRKRV